MPPAVSITFIKTYSYKKVKSIKKDPNELLESISYCAPTVLSTLASC